MPTKKINKEATSIYQNKIDIKQAKKDAIDMGFNKKRLAWKPPLSKHEPKAIDENEGTILDHPLNDANLDQASQYKIESTAILYNGEKKLTKKELKELNGQKNNVTPFYKLDQVPYLTSVNYQSLLNLPEHKQQQSKKRSKRKDNTIKKDERLLYVDDLRKENKTFKKETKHSKEKKG